MLKALVTIIDTVDRQESQARAERITRINTRSYIKNVQSHRIRNLKLLLDTRQVKKVHIKQQIAGHNHIY